MIAENTNTGSNTCSTNSICHFLKLVRLFYEHAAVTCEGAIVHFADTAKTMISLCMKDLKMFGLETNFESTRPIPYHVETKTISLSSRPRPVSRRKPVSRPTSLLISRFLDNRSTVLLMLNESYGELLQKLSYFNKRIKL